MEHRVPSRRCRSRRAEVPSATNWLGAFVIAIAGCTSGDDAPQGKVALEFAGISESGVTFSLVNGLNHSIYVRGAARVPSGVVDVMSADTEISCQMPSTPESGAVGGTSMFAFVHGIGEWPYAEVPPKGRATLAIETKFPQQFHGGPCRLQLRLKDETVVGPAEFTP